MNTYTQTDRSANLSQHPASTSQVDMRTHREDMSHIVASTIVLHDLEHICLTYDRVLPKRSEMKSDCYPCIYI
jgi:hypothetical protein